MTRDKRHKGLISFTIMVLMVITIVQSVIMLRMAQHSKEAWSVLAGSHIWIMDESCSAQLTSTGAIMLKLMEISTNGDR